LNELASKLEVAMLNERFKIQGLRFGVEQNNEPQKPHFLK
jgi:hypothetical protein